MRTAYGADRLAAEALVAVERDKALLVVPAQARAAWRFARVAPTVMRRMTTRFVAQQRQRQGL
ncbi:hypothetical protein QSJ19_12370 [Gordonia sp. ABSL11-1]|uniref:hypothetical protein n=1 Tax=Gordonia sp. ABSL11-1 TaxID=3053924 RepID=UPI00257374FB|nr:hypothetical protein [Gordonia sp. ABSL11-1]MDL9946375.1 hypothetical protein [Gordonia sp. ABSL11-1]